ncbi:MAG: ribose 5-phosphate isomerase B [Sphingomonas fennica]
MARSIAFANDHAAAQLKGVLMDWARGRGHAVTDLGSDGSTSVDYPDYGFALAREVAAGRADVGVALCGSGVGISIAVNRVAGCRCALVSDPLTARLSREHNDSNVVAMGARLIGPDMAIACLDAFLATDFAGGRHQRRIDKLSASPEELSA